MKDIYIGDFGNNYTLTILNNSQQRAENWVRVDNRLSFSKFGVDYKSLILETQDINTNTLKTKIINDLGSANMSVEEVIETTQGSDTTFKIKVVN
jgi:hypothetical protein